MTTPIEQQQRAIEARGAVLLAAGAGTGKTATLVARCTDLVTRHGVGVDRLLVVTFTNAAAAELKQRLREALTQAAAAPSGGAALERQLLLLESAHISTIHSFCLDLLRAHFAELGLAPGVAVLEESVTAPLARHLALELVREAVGRGTETQDLIEQYGAGSGERLAELMLRVHRFFVTQPQADLLLARELERQSAGDAASWREGRRQIAATWLREAVAWVEEGARQALATLRANAHRGKSNKTGTAIARVESELPQFVSRLTSWASSAVAEPVVTLLAEAVRVGSDEIWGYGTRGAREGLARFFEEAGQLLAWHPVGDADPLDADWARVRGPMRRLLELTRDFGARYTEAKRALGGVDFADLEQLALRLLLDAHGQPTAVARAWRERLDYVFVDECQDINAAQDALIRAVAREDDRANLFLVGDVKQSIYRFRLAAPELLQEHARMWPRQAHHQVLPLTDNFRSREGILAFVNDLFVSLFPHLGGLAYGADERLNFALPNERRPLSLAPADGEAPAGAWPDADCRVELHVVPDPPRAESEGEAGRTGEGWGDLLSLERQAHVAAVRLRELEREGHQVWDKDQKGFRPMVWSDVGVLMRSVTGRAAAFVREFRRQGIPLVIEQGDFLETLEATDLVALLRVLDNPRQDIPLFAVLRSPLVGWTLEELATLSGAEGRPRAWGRLEAAARRDDLMAGRARKFLADLGRWRRLALMTSLTAVLETVLAETRYEAYLMTLADGLERVANVRRFLDLAQRYDPFLRQGLSRFLRFVDDQQAAGREIEPLPPRAASAAQLLSVHKSKGLEFPVVVLAGMGSAFQDRESRESVLLSRRWGLAPKVVDLAQRRRHDSLLLWRVKQEEKLAMLAEELRLLYVAVTRARDTLLLVGSFKPGSTAWKERSTLPPALGIPQALSCAEWLSRWLGDRVDWSGGSGEVAFPTGAPVARIRWRTHEGQAADAAGEAQEPGGRAEVAPLSPGQLERLDWGYPHAAAVDLPAKTSATALRRLGAVADEETAMLPGPQRAFAALPEPAPAADRTERLPATAIGTAHHCFLEHVDLACTASVAGLAAERERLGAAGVLTADEAAALDLNALLGFWTTPLGAELRQHGARVHRELAFTAAFAPPELAAFGERFATMPADEFVVVQGAVDLAVLLPGEIWIVDFKTDRITESELPARADEHERQLRLYAAALHRIYGRPVTRCVLHFLALHRSWEVADPMRGPA